LEGRTFFATMLDPSLRCLSVLPGVPSLLAAFEERLCQQVDDFATLALAKAKSRQEEGAELEQALATGIAEVNAEGAQLIDEFIDLKTEVRFLIGVLAQLWDFLASLSTVSTVSRLEPAILDTSQAGRVG
jgi:hypothetical protein